LPIKTYPKILDMDKQELTAILEEALKPIMTAIDTLAITLQGLVDKMPEIQTEPKKEMSLEVTKDNQIGDMPDIQPAVDTMPTDQVLPDGEMLPTDVEKEKEKEKEIEVCIEVAVSKAVEYALKEHGIIKSNDELTQIENSFNNISNLKTFMKQASNEELVAEPQATGITTNDGELKKYNRNDAVKNVKNIYNN
jgi:hypothetical protein